MGIVQIAVIGVLGALFAIQFKGGKQEYGIYIGIALSIFVFLGILDRVEVIIESIREIGEKIQMEGEFLSVLFKMLGVAYVAEFAASICKDAGHQTIAGQIEIFSRITILALGIPILRALLETIQAFLG